MLRFRRDFNAKAGRQLVSRLQANLALRPAILLKKSHASQLYTRYRRVTERSRNSFVFSASSRMRMLSRASVGDSRAQLRASSTFRRSFLRRSVLKQLACRAHVLYFAAQRYLKNRSHPYFRFVRMLTVVRRRRYRVIPLWRIVRKRK